MAYNISRLEIVIDSRSGERSLRNLQGSLDRTERRGTRSFNALRAAAMGFSGVLASIGAAGFSREIFNAVASAQKLKASLETVTGSLENASAAWSQLTEFAKETPFTLDQSIEAFIRMKSMGLDPTEDALRSFGNTASAMSKDMMQMVEAVADAATGEFERLKEFGIRASKEGDNIAFTFQGITKRVENSADAVTAYLEDIGSTKFAGAMSAQMDTLSGKMANLEDNTYQLYLALGDAGATGVFASGIETASGAVGDLTSLIKEGELDDTFNAIGTAMGGVALIAGGRLAGALVSSAVAFGAAQVQAVRYQAALASMAGVSRLAATSQLALGAATRTTTAAMGLMGGPVGAAVVAAGSLYYFRDALFDTKSEAEELRDELGEVTDQMDGFSRARLASEKSKILEDMARIRGEANLLKLDLSEALEGGIPVDGMGRGAARVRAMKEEIASLEAQAAVMQKSYEDLDNLQDKRDQQAENRRSRNKPINSLGNMEDLGFGRSLFDGFEDPVRPSSSDLAKMASGPSYDSLMDRVDADDRGDRIIAAQMAEFEATRSHLDRTYAIEQAHQQRMQDLRDGARLGLVQSEEELNNLILASTQERNEQLRQEESSRYQFLEESQASAMGAIGSAMGNFAEIAKQGGKESFQSYKNLATGQAIIATALAANKALASNIPPPLNIALAASIGALGAVQVAKIQGQEFSGQAHDGFTSLPSSGSWNLEKGERVLSSQQNRDMTQFLDRENRGGGSAAQSPPISPTVVLQFQSGVTRAEVEDLIPGIERRVHQGMIKAIGNGGPMARAVGRK